MSISGIPTSSKLLFGGTENELCSKSPLEKKKKKKKKFNEKFVILKPWKLLKFGYQFQRMIFLFLGLMMYGVRMMLPKDWIKHPQVQPLIPSKSGESGPTSANVYLINEQKDRNGMISNSTSFKFTKVSYVSSPELPIVGV